MKVAVYGKQFQKEVAPFVQELFQELEKANMEVLVFEPFYNFLSQQMSMNLFLGTYNTYEELKERCFDSENPDKYQSVTSDNADYFVQEEDD